MDVPRPAGPRPTARASRRQPLDACPPFLSGRPICNSGRIHAGRPGNRKVIRKIRPLSRNRSSLNPGTAHRSLCPHTCRLRRASQPANSAKTSRKRAKSMIFRSENIPGRAQPSFASCPDGETDLIVRSTLPSGSAKVRTAAIIELNNLFHSFIAQWLHHVRVKWLVFRREMR